MINFRLFILICVVISTNLYANDELIKEFSESLSRLSSEIEITGVEETPIKGIYQVLIGPDIIYMTRDANFVLKGEILDIGNRRNLTEDVRAENRINLLSSIKKDEYIEFSSNLNKHHIYVFTDVDCGYCRKFHSEINGYIDLGIQVNYLAFPRTGLESDSFKKIVSAWCNDDPHSSITELKLGKEIEINLCSKNPVIEHFNLGQKMGISGTPSILTTEGKMIPGYVSPKELFELLNS